MIDRFARLPSSLTDRARTVRLGRHGQIPALLIHPNWIDPAPTMLWMHGRTVNKELDAGRYVRWMKEGIAACAIDLPGHGERSDDRAASRLHTLEILAETLPEIDEVIESLADPVWQNVFDLDRLGIGGMSLGGMASLRRLCDPHPFIAAAVEGTTGNIAGLYTPADASSSAPLPGDDARWPTAVTADQVRRLDPAANLTSFAPIPLLALHSEADRIVPIHLQRGFVDNLRAHYTARGADPALIQLHTWPTTGAPDEHAGFGRFGNDAKNLQTAFLKTWLRPARRPAT